MHRCYPECRPGHHVHKSMENVYRSEVQSLKAKMPNPDNFDIKDVFEYGEYKVLIVHYPGCTNFNGEKCMVVKCSMIDLIKAKRLDPHFDKVKPLSNIEIVARFPPSQEGISRAKAVAAALRDDNLVKHIPRGGPGDR